MSVIPLSELKEHLNQLRSVPALDAELQRLLDAAEGHVINLCGPLALGARTVTAHLSGDHLVLPVIRLTSVAAVRDPDGQTVTVTADRTNLLSGIIRVPYRRAGAWSVDVTSGPDNVPAPLRTAVLIVAAHLHETQRAASGGGGARPPGMGGDEPAGGVPMGVLVPRRAELLMRPYLLPPVIG